MNRTKALKKIIESYGPLLISAIGTLLIVYLLKKCSNIELFGGDFNGTFDRILDSSVVFASIIVGFSGVLMGILFSISERRIMKSFFRGYAKSKMKTYFGRNILAGLLLVFISLGLYMRDYFMDNMGGGIAFVWLFLLLYVLSSAYRIISIMMHVLFSLDDDNENAEPKAVRMDSSQAADLEKKYARD